MKHVLIAAIALVIASPAVAQTAPATGQHAQHQNHAQHGEDHAQHGQSQAGHDMHKGHDMKGDCCADKDGNGRMDCCEKMGEGKGCCAKQEQKPATQPERKLNP